MNEIQENAQGNKRDASGPRVDVSHYYNVHSIQSRIARGIWVIVWTLLYRPSPKALHWWRKLLLRTFGAKIGRGAHIYPSVKVWAPWNLTMADYSCLASDVDCYCVAPISIGAHTTVSQYSFLCAASHDFEQFDMPLVTKPIVVEDQVWICADVFVGPGVTIEQGAVVGARSTVVKNVARWTIVAGNPARFVKQRVLREQ